MLYTFLLLRPVAIDALKSSLLDLCPKVASFTDLLPLAGRSILCGVTLRLSGCPLHPVVRPPWTESRVMGLDHGWTAFRNRSESETQPSAISALRSEAS